MKDCKRRQISYANLINKLFRAVIHGPIGLYPAVAVASAYGFSKALARLRAFGRLQTKGGFVRWTAATRTDWCQQVAFVAGASFAVGFSMETFMVYTGFYKIVTKKVRRCIPPDASNEIQAIYTPHVTRYS
jgi:hypothetical protein